MLHERQNTLGITHVTLDFERLFTNIPTGDMHSKIMQLIGEVFADHPGHAGLKVWEQAPAVWFTVAQMPANDAAQHGTGYAGKLSIFDLATIYQSINQFTFSAFRTHQGSQQTITAKILRMLSLNETSHSMLFWATKRSKFCSQQPTSTCT